MASFAQHFWNLWSHLTEKPVLWAVRDQGVMRKLYEINAPLVYRRFKDMEFKPDVLPCTDRQVPVLWCDRGHSDSSRLVLYLHGGGFCIGSPKTHCRMIAALAGAIGARGLGVDYRLAPEHPFPAGVEDSVAAYRAVLAAGWQAENIILAGDSAGGTLVLALLHEIGVSGLPMPAGALTIAPATDLTGQSPSLRENRFREHVIPLAWLKVSLSSYLTEGLNAKDPRISPVFGSYEGACPVFITVGTGEILRDDSRRMAETLRAQGVAVTYEEIPHVHHIWPLRYGRSRDADQAVAKMAEFALGCLSTRD